MVGAIDRRSLVRRHNVTRSTVDYRVPTQVGNGRFAFNMDITGLQTFVPFATLSDWGWHSYPVPAGTDIDAYRGRAWDFHGRSVVVEDVDPDQPVASDWLRDNPHRLNLGRIGLLLLRTDGSAAVGSDLDNCRQDLDLWTGTVTSHVELDGVPIDVRTTAHPDLDAVAVSIHSPLLATGRLSVLLDFPDGDDRYFARQVGDWASPRRHCTTVDSLGSRRARLRRDVDDTAYHVELAWAGDAVLTEPILAADPRTLRVIRAAYGEHDVTTAAGAAVRNQTLAFTVDGDLLGGHPAEPEVRRDLDLEYQLGAERHAVRIPYGGLVRLGDDVFRHRHLLGGGQSEQVDLVAAFGPDPIDELPTAAQTRDAAAEYWPQFWCSGGAIELAGSTDPRALELERRIVLSQYVMAVNEAGSLPPQETGLVNNSWNGRFHFEMYFWHAAHWALWGRWPILRRSLDIYQRLLPSAVDRARRQGFEGAKWPKCTGPDGRESPGEIHALLVWQQPHVFFFAELDYRAHPSQETLDRWAPVLSSTADFLASYLVERDGRFVLGPPVHIVSENTDPAQTINPAFELAYWRFGLRIAQTWRERLGQPRVPHWDDVLDRLAPLPVEHAEYAIYQGIEHMWERYTFEHPALSGLFGWLPGDGVNPTVMRATAKRIFAEWDRDRIWGWDFPMLAMCAARLGQPEQAVEFLTHNGERFQFTETGLPTGGPFPYLPSSGSLLYAVAMMAGGWDGSDGPTPGFPDESAGWVVRCEGLQQAL